MSFKHKFSYEEKVKILSEYLDGTYGFREVCRRYNINQGSLKDWKRLYETFGLSGLKTESKTSHYSKEVKESAVRDYLSHALTVPEILKKYQIRSGTQLRKWIMKYNGHEKLKSSGTGGNSIMTKGRKTTFEERVEIVQYCIAHDHNYSEASEKYQVSYQQARSYTVKYESGGVEALKDNRGKRKNPDELSELEKLRAEIKILRAEKERAEMETSFLKKLDEIERRRG
jgi:transposase-like protein